MMAASSTFVFVAAGGRDGKSANAPMPGEAFQARRDEVQRLVFDVDEALGGSISAEHGIGRLKRSDFESRLSDVQRRMITGLKNTFDPELRMNPGCQITLHPDS